MDLWILFLKLDSLLQKRQSQGSKRKRVKALWNVILKYWKDQSCECYGGISSTTEWLVIEDLNYYFKMSPMSKFDFENELLQDSLRSSAFSLMSWEA